MPNFNLKSPYKLDEIHDMIYGLLFKNWEGFVSKKQTLRFYRIK